MFGWSEMEVLGRNVYDILFSAEKKPLYQEKIDRHFNQSLPAPQPLALIGRHKKQSDIQMELQLVSSKEDDESIFLYFINDVSELKKQFDIIQIQNQQLREIAWMQSHTIRAPLVRIMGLVHLLNTNSNDFAFNDLTANIEKSANELDKVIHDISNKTYELENSSKDQISKMLHVSKPKQKEEHAPLKVLLIDDDNLVTNLNKIMLNKNGFTDNLFCFDNANTAIDFLNSEVQPNENILIFLDLYMPGMNGWAFLDLIQTLPINQQVEVIILTSSSNPFEKEKARAYSNVIMYLEKELTDRNITEIKKVINYNPFFI